MRSTGYPALCFLDTRRNAYSRNSWVFLEGLAFFFLSFLFLFFSSGDVILEKYYVRHSLDESFVLTVQLSRFLCPRHWGSINSCFVPVACIQAAWFSGQELSFMLNCIQFMILVFNVYFDWLNYYSFIIFKLMQLQHPPWNYFFLIYHHVNPIKRILTLKIFLSYNAALFALYYQTLSCETFPSSWKIVIVEMFHGRNELAFLFVCFCVFWFLPPEVTKIPILKLIIDLTVRDLFIHLVVAESWLGTNGILESIFLHENGKCSV